MWGPKKFEVVSVNEGNLDSIQPYRIYLLLNISISSPISVKKMEGIKLSGIRGGGEELSKLPLNSLMKK